jgi:hypothetical protein
MTAPLAQRLREAADAIEELMRGYRFAEHRRKYASVNADFLRREANVLEAADVCGDIGDVRHA